VLASTLPRRADPPRGTKFPHPIVSHSHNVVTEAFLNVTRIHWQHAQGVIDFDVQLALGVFFYTNGAYDRQGLFRSGPADGMHSEFAIEPLIDPSCQDHLLWDRLGSSLSNRNKPEESLGAYREALILRPTYTRAIYCIL
jgi:peroxin-5